MIQQETTITICPNSPALSELSTPLNFIAYYTHFKEYGGVPTITLSIELNSLYELCEHAGFKYGYRRPLTAEGYASNLNKCALLVREAACFEGFNRLPTIAEDDKGSDCLFVCKFCPKSYNDQYESAEAGGLVLNSIVAASNARPCITRNQRRLSYRDLLATPEVSKLMREVVAKALGLAVVHFSVLMPEYEAFLNALEGDYMAGVNESFTTEIVDSVREHMGSISLDMPRMF